MLYSILSLICKPILFWQLQLFKMVYVKALFNLELGCANMLACDPRRRLHRYLVLILICLMSFGSYFCYDNPSALENVFLRDLKLSPSEYTSLYSWYGWPNVVLSLMAGFLIDRVFGIRLGGIIFAAFILIGEWEPFCIVTFGFHFL